MPPWWAQISISDVFWPQLATYVQMGGYRKVTKPGLCLHPASFGGRRASTAPAFGFKGNKEQIAWIYFSREVSLFMLRDFQKIWDWGKRRGREKRQNTWNIAKFEFVINWNLKFLSKTFWWKVTLFRYPKSNLLCVAWLWKSTSDDSNPNLNNG